MSIPVPSEGAFDAPSVCLNLNERWANIVSTCLNDLLTSSQWGIDRSGVYAANITPVWDGDSEFADQQIQAIMAALAAGNCVE